MKMHTVERVAQTDGSLSSTKFGIATNAKMISILSDKLYGNKIRAVIRELSTNAWDSHKDAGHESPFDIHLPTIIEPFFYIRDYGTGMSPETFEKVYVWYGNSSKDQSNEFTGCLGLGSKTPFCYNTKTATITVWYNGNKRIYTLYPDDEGMPKADLVSDTATNEPNGVQIMLSVDRQEISDFEYEAQDIYQFFPVKPKFIGKQTTITELKYEFQGTNWGVVSDIETLIVMGNVAYPVNVANLKLTTEAQKSILTRRFIINVDIGYVDIQPSREGLEYNNITKLHIVHRVNEIIKEANSIAELKIVSAKSLWEARRIAASLKHMNGIFNAIDLKSMLWNGIPLGLDAFGRLDISGITKHNDLGTGNNSVSISHYRHDSWRAKQKKYDFVQNIIPTDNIYVNDLKGGFLGRMNEHCKNTSDTYCIMTGPDASPSDIQALKDFLGITDAELKKTSTLTSVSNANRSGSGIGKFSKVVELQTSLISHNRITSNWKNTTIDLDKGGVYVEFNRYRTVKFETGYLKRVFDTLRGSEFNVSIPPIYGVKSADIKDLDTTKWKSLHEWLCDQYELLYIKHGSQLEQSLAYRKEVEGYNSNNPFFVQLHELNNKLPLEGLADIIRDFNIAKKLSDKVEFYQQMQYIGASLDIVKSPGSVVTFNLKDRLKQLGQRYVILKKLDSSFINQNLAEVLRYVSFINQGVKNVSV